MTLEMSDPVDKLTFKDQFRGFAVSQFLCRTFDTLDVRIAHYDSSTDPAHPDFSGPCIWVFWHEYIFAPIAMWRKCDVTMLVSQHRDGDWLTHAATRIGFKGIRGSTNRGGANAIRELKKMKNSCGVGITPDGPRGPRREMALGPVYLASRLGLPIVATGFGYKNPKRLNSWDKFAIPIPFSRARVVMSPKIHLPNKLGRDGLEAKRLEIQTLLEDVTNIAEDWADSGKRMRNEVLFQRRPNRSWRDCNDSEKPVPSVRLHGRSMSPAA